MRKESAGTRSRALDGTALTDSHRERGVDRQEQTTSYSRCSVKHARVTRAPAHTDKTLGLDICVVIMMLEDGGWHKLNYSDKYFCN